MCKVMEDMRSQAIEQDREDRANKMLSDGLSVEKVSEYSGLSIDRVREIAGESIA